MHGDVVYQSVIVIHIQVSVRRYQGAATAQVIACATLRLPGEIRTAGAGIRLGEYAPALSRLIPQCGTDGAVDPPLVSGELLRRSAEIQAEVPVSRPDQCVDPAPVTAQEGIAQ